MSTIREGSASHMVSVGQSGVASSGHSTGARIATAAQEPSDSSETSGPAIGLLFLGLAFGAARRRRNR